MNMLDELQQLRRENKEMRDILSDIASHVQMCDCGHEVLNHSAVGCFEIGSKCQCDKIPYEIIMDYIGKRITQ